MKHYFLALSAIVALLAIPTGSIARDVPAEGSTIKGSLVIGRSTFALPPGEWKVITVNSTHTTIDGRHTGGSEVVSVYSVQLAADGTLIAVIVHTAPLVTTNAPASWNDSTCDRKNTLYRDDFSVNPNFPECLLINHIVRFWVDTPKNELSRKRWDWYQANKIKLPSTVLEASYRKYFSGDYVRVTFAVNPEFFGQAPSIKTAWAESEWHPLVIKNDPKRLAFVENFKKWSYVMASSAKSTLMDRKPNSASLPALDELRVVAP